MRNRDRILALRARDGRTCYLCALPMLFVDDGAVPEDDFRASIDHVVPLCVGGSDSDDNVRLAHAWCNSARLDATRRIVKERLVTSPRAFARRIVVPLYLRGALDASIAHTASVFFEKELCLATDAGPQRR